MALKRLIREQQPPRLQTKTITENGEYKPDEKYDGFRKVVVDVAGGGSEPVINELNVTPTTSAQTITPETGVDGFGPVNVTAVDSSIDANIVAANIVSGVSILGVAGSAAVLDGEEISITPTTSQQIIEPTSPKNGITKATVAAVDSSIDANITPANIVSGTTILGVAGSAIELNGETVSVTPTTSAQTITPTAPKNGITEVSVAAVTAAIDANIVAENIKNGVTILNVVGSYKGSGGTDEYANVIGIENTMKGTSFVEADEIDTACDDISMFLFGTANV